MAGSRHHHSPRNATAHRAACTNSHNHFGAQTRRLRSGYVDWRIVDTSGFGVRSGTGKALVRMLFFPSLRLQPVEYVLVHCCWSHLLRLIKKILMG